MAMINSHIFSLIEFSNNKHSYSTCASSHHCLQIFLIVINALVEVSVHYIVEFSFHFMTHFLDLLASNYCACNCFCVCHGVCIVGSCIPKSLISLLATRG